MKSFLHIILAVTCFVSSTTYSQTNTPPPLGQSTKPAGEKLQELENVSLDEKPLATVALDSTFNDETGAPVVLKDLLLSKPAILTFNYSNCPMLCTVQLGGLVEVLNKMKSHVGVDFDVITIGLDPTETHGRAMETKMSYLDRYKPKGADKVVAQQIADKGWRFITGTKENIDQVADSVGFGYFFLESKSQYLHPSVLTMLSPKGKVTGYIHGVAFEPDDMETAIQKAADGIYQKPVTDFLLTCYRYIQATGFAKTGMDLMRLGGLLFVFVMAGTFTWLKSKENKAKAKKDFHPSEKGIEA